MKFCTQVPRTCMHKTLALDFHLFAQIWSWTTFEFQTVYKIQPIYIRYLPNLQFFGIKTAKMLHTQNCIRNHTKNAKATKFSSQPSKLPKEAFAKLHLSTTVGLSFMTGSVAPPNC